MFAYSIFSYSQAAATARAFSAFSLFGYLELKAPTLAERAIEEERRAGEPGRKSLLDRLAAPDRGIVLTIFGGSEIVLPTLAEEYTALKSLVDSGRIRLDQLDGWLARLDEGLSWAAITLFGSCTIRRGEARDEQEALDRALRSGAIRSAALDVYHHEPVDRDDELLKLPNVLCTPHIGSQTLDAMNTIAELILARIAEFERHLEEIDEAVQRSQIRVGNDNVSFMHD